MHIKKIKATLYFFPDIVCNTGIFFISLRDELLQTKF